MKLTRSEDRFEASNWFTAVRCLPVVIAVLAALPALWAHASSLGSFVPTAPDALARSHGILFLNGCVGTLAALSRAENIGRSPAYLPAIPVAVGVSLYAGGLEILGPITVFLGSAGLTGLFVALSLQRRGSHYVVLGIAAAIWTASNIFWAAGWSGTDLLPWWGSFLLWGVVGLRLELATVQRPGRTALAWLSLPLVATILGLGLSSLDSEWGLRTIGVGFAGLALWLAIFDIARDAVRAPGLTGFIGTSLLSGFAWLSIAGWSMIATRHPDGPLVATGTTASLFVGFVLFMIFAHVPPLLSRASSGRRGFARQLYIAPALTHTVLVVQLVTTFGSGPTSIDITGGGLVASLAVFGLLLLQQFSPSYTAPEPRRATETTTRRVR